MIMNKKTALLATALMMLGIVATVGVIASTVQPGMIKKGVSTMPEGRRPEGRSEYDQIMTDEELMQLEAALKAAEQQTPAAAEQPMIEEDELIEENIIPVQ